MIDQPANQVTNQARCLHYAQFVENLLAVCAVV